MTNLTLLLLVDAFRPDYLRDAPYLRRLAARSAVGKLRETFGFLPRAAYFGGLSTNDYGLTHMLHRDPERSPFGATRWLPPAAFTTVSTAGSVRQHVDEQARSRVSDFASSYVSSLNIPPELLHHFAVSETEAPWSPKAGYRSIFHELDERGEPWVAATWPLTNRLPDPSDRGIVAHLLSSLHTGHRFAYAHLQALDAAGHQYGPEAMPLRQLVRDTDVLVGELIETLRGKYDELRVIVFGDHGMVSVTRSIDVRPSLMATGLVPGVDFVYFLDSTMVRLWFLTSRAREPISRALSEVAGLRLVTAADKVRHRIDKCSEANAHEIYLAEPGIVISPDFFSSGAVPPRGMHGYDPDCVDNQGIFIAHAPELTSSDAGVVDATEIHAWTREMLGLTSARVNRTAPLPHADRRFTQSAAPDANRSVGRQLDKVLACLRPSVDGAEAVVLTGSFGRGEGGTVARDSEISAVNDFDVLVVGGPDISGELAQMASSIAARVGLDFLDLAWTDGAWNDVAPTMLNLDIKYGSEVLTGDPDVLDRMPIVAAGDIPLYDAQILLLNRVGGLLSGLKGSMFLTGRASEGDKQYLVNQIVKALVAVGDSYLVEWRAYDASYRTRRERFASLSSGAGVDDDVRNAVDDAYRLKVEPDYDELPDPCGAARAAAPVLLERLCSVVGSAAGLPFTSVAQAATALRAVTGEWVAVDNARLLTRTSIARLAVSTGGTERSVRQELYAALIMLLAAPTRQAFNPFDRAAGGARWYGADSRLECAADWESARCLAVTAWLAMNH